MVVVAVMYTTVTTKAPKADETPPSPTNVSVDEDLSPQPPPWLWDVVDSSEAPNPMWADAASNCAIVKFWACSAPIPRLYPLTSVADPTCALPLSEFMDCLVEARLSVQPDFRPETQSERLLA